MAKKRKIEGAEPHMIQLSKTDFGYDVVIEEFRTKLPSDAEIHDLAVRVCGGYDSPDSLATLILKRSSLTLELVNVENVYENRIGVILWTDADDAALLRTNPELYGEIMSAIGEACPSIEHDRIESISAK